MPRKINTKKSTATQRTKKGIRYKIIAPAEAISVTQGYHATSSYYLDLRTKVPTATVTARDTSASSAQLNLRADGSLDIPQNKSISFSVKSSAPAAEIEDVFALPKTVRISSRFSVPRHWRRQLAVFVCLMVVITMPLQAFTYYQDAYQTKDRILSMTNEAIENLKSGQSAVGQLDFGLANQDFVDAKNNFSNAHAEIDQLNFLSTELLKIIPGEGRKVAAGISLIEAGELISSTGELLSAGGRDVLASKGSQGYYNSLVDFRSKLQDAIAKFDEASRKIKAIDPQDLPAEHRATLERITTYLPTVDKGLRDAYTINTVMLKFLGHDQWQRYMLIFMNNNEIRGGGGFMGSYGLMDIDRGEIKNLTIPGGGTYDIQGQLVPRVISPDPLHLINPRWEFQDANWWPDFPETAQKIDWFNRNAQGPSVDGVIAITTTFMERLLAIYGPIEMPEYGRTITADNFALETEKIVELEYNKTQNRPKQFIGDLAPKLMDKVFNSSPEQMQKLFTLMTDALNQKHLMVYFMDPQIEGVITDFGWSGSIRSTAGDYLMAVNSNIAGGKTDRIIDETINHQADVQPDGSIIDTVTIIRHHNGKAGENVFTGVQNNDYLRLYVPQGSILLEATGFKKPPVSLFQSVPIDFHVDADLARVETNHVIDPKTQTDIYTESGKTVFGNWLQLKPGETQTSVIRYRLPMTLTQAAGDKLFYSLLIQRQPGSNDATVTSTLQLPDSYSILAKFPTDIQSVDHGVLFSAPLITDQFYGVAVVAN